MLVDACLRRKGLELNWQDNTGTGRLKMFDEEVKKPGTHEVGMLLDAMSVEELNERITLLEAEIARLRVAIEGRGVTRKAADAAFKF